VGARVKLHLRRGSSGIQSAFDGLTDRDRVRLRAYLESHSQSKSSRAGYPQPTAKSGAKKGKPA